MAPPTVRYFSTSRVENYTDAVFAIAATLLVLDLTTTALGKPASDGAMWASLAGMGDRFLAFGISFGLLSMLWVIHLQQWRDIARVDVVMLWINNARLLFVVLIPFTTSLVADYSAFYAGRMLLPLNFFFAALAGVLSWSWATARNRHLVREDDAAEADKQGLGGISALICGAVAAIVAPWIGSWGFLAYVFNAPLEQVLRRVRRRRLTAKSPD